MSMLDELATEAKAKVLAERPTQPATDVSMGWIDWKIILGQRLVMLGKNWHSLMRRAVVHLGARKKVDK